MAASQSDSVMEWNSVSSSPERKEAVIQDETNLQMSVKADEKNVSEGSDGKNNVEPSLNLSKRSKNEKKSVSEGSDSKNDAVKLSRNLSKRMKIEGKSASEGSDDKNDGVKQSRNLSKRTKTDRKDASEGSDGKSDDVKTSRNPTKQLTMEDISNMIVKCSSCGNQMNHHDADRVKIHPHLKVLICKDCLEYYGSGNFSQDEDGDKYCRWCAEGGQMFGCDYCSNVFCRKCLLRNFGRGEACRIQENTWNCYACDSSQIQEKVDYCNMIIKYSKSKHSKVYKKMNQNTRPSDLLDLDSSLPGNWLPKALDNALIECSKYNRRLEKLKKFALKKKSSRQIIKKWEQTADTYKSGIKALLVTVNKKYGEYLKTLTGTKAISVIDLSDDSKESGLARNNVKKDAVMEDSSMEDTVMENTVMEDAVMEDAVMEGAVMEGAVRKHTDKKNTVECDTYVEANSHGQVDRSNISSRMNNEAKSTKDFPHLPSVALDAKAQKSISDINRNSPEPPDPELRHDLAAIDSDSDVGNLLDETVPNVGVLDCASDDSDHQVRLTSDKTGSVVNDVNDSAKALLLCEGTDDSDASTIPDTSGAKKVVPKDIDSTDSSTDETSDDSDFEKDERPVKSIRRKRKSNIQCFTTADIRDKSEVDQEKLKSLPIVLVQRLPLPMSETKLFEEAASSVDELESLKKKVESLSKLPTVKKASVQSNKKPAEVKQKKAPAKRKLSSSDSFEFTSEDETPSGAKEETDPEENSSFLEKGSKKAVETINDQSKTALLAADSSSSEMDIFSDSSEDIDLKQKKEKSKSGKNPLVIDLDANESSNDSFVISKKKKKLDKLDRIPLISSGDEGSKKENKTTKQKKRRRLVFSSDDSSKSKKDSSGLSSSTSSDSDSKSKGKKKGKKRRRIKTADDSSNESGDGESQSQGTPGKGRKNIRKVISDRKLASSTIEAQALEKERRKRISDRQKLYNQIVESSADGLSTITRKMVLEVDQESKEEIVQINPDLVEKLKPHQVSGVKFMWESTIESLKELDSDKGGSGCILAHCMGLGKSLQVITYIHTLLTNEYVKKKLHTAMVICPYNTVLNWGNEFDYWLDDIKPSIHVFDVSQCKNNHDRCDLLQQWQKLGGVFIIGYNLFTRLTDGKLGKCNKKVKTSIFQSICDPGPDIVICDEGHLLKNENSALSRAACKLRTMRRVILTGTPLQNNLKEYHCMMHFVKPNLLGTLREFTNRFVNPISNGQYDDSSQHDVKLMKKRVHILHKLLEGCVQRCDYSALTKYLPPKHEFVISVKLSELQIKMYRHYLDNFARGNKSLMDGGKLFQDLKVLKLIWTYPYLMLNDYYRMEKKRLFMDNEDEDSLINDSTEDSEKSKDNAEEDPKPGISNKEASSSSDDEVIRTYTTRSRASEFPEEEVTPENSRPKQWFDEYMSEDDDKFKVEMSGKIILLLDILRECESIGDKVLLFSTSILTLDMIEDILQYLDEKEEDESENKIADTMDRWVPNIDYFRMDGGTSGELRKRWIELFNDPNNDRGRLFLISTKAGSLGTNLIGANRVILMDASWNPSHDVQAIFRVYRFGQVKPVYVYRLLAQGTMEEKIYNRQVTKLSMSCRVVDEQQIDRHFNAADLSELYTLDVQTDHPTPMVPKDRLLADILIRRSDWIVKYHEHDSLLQSSTEDDLTEEERQNAWAEYENEKDILFNKNEAPQTAGFQPFVDPNLIPNVDVLVQKIFRDLKAANPTITAHATISQLLAQLQHLRSYYQTQHVQALRAKQMHISKGESVPPNITSLQLSVEKVLDRIAGYIDAFQKQFVNLVNQSKFRQPPQTQPAFQPRQFPSANYQRFYTYSKQPTYNQMNQFAPPMNIRYTPSASKATVIDVSNEAVGYDVSTPSSGVVTEVDDVQELRTNAERASSVEITEID